MEQEKDIIVADTPMDETTAKIKKYFDEGMLLVDAINKAMEKEKPVDTVTSGPIEE
jgi:hypothetical protein